MVVNWETRMLQWVIWRLLGVPDTDDVKQKNKPWNNTKQILPWTENKEIFCFTLSVSGKKVLTSHSNQISATKGWGRELLEDAGFSKVIWLDVAWIGTFDLFKWTGNK